MKRILALCLMLVMLFTAFTACGSGGNDSGSGSAPGNGDSSTTAPPADTAILYHAYISTPYVTLDPRSEQSNGIMVLQNVYETLTRYNELTGEVDPLLASEWSVSDDGLEWVFTIVEGVTFHDGSEMTAKNVESSIRNTIEIGQGASYIWDSVETIEATGDYEVTFTLSYPAPIDLISSAGYAAYIFSDSVLDKNTEWFNEGNDGGTGPYTISQATGDTVVLSAYEDYRGGWSENQYKNVLIKEVSESSARRQMLETGEAQIASDFSSTDLTALRGMTDKVTIYEAGTFTNALLCLNTASEPMSNVDFRRGVAYAFPYQETIDSVLDGNGVQSHGMIPDGLWGHDDSLMQYTTDLDKAREHLDASGIDYEGLSLLMTYPTGFDAYASWGQLLQVNLKQLGIELELRSMEWDAQWAQAQNNDPAARQDIFVFQWWPDFPSPAAWFDVLVHSEESIAFNLAYVNSPEFDEMCETANDLVVNDREAAEAVYVELQEKLLDECQYIFPYDTMRTYAISPAISGVHENPAYATAVQYYNVTY